jgi:D-3-phosphoglycerate dehydrogenase
MTAVFLDCTADLLKLWQQVLLPDDPAIAVNMDTARSVDVLGAIAGHDTLINDHTQFNAELLERCETAGLRHIVFLGTGAASYIDLAAAEKHAVKVSTIKGYGDTAVAEQAMALLFAAARGVARMDRGIRVGRWQTLEGLQLRGKRLGIIGLGGIGRELARIAAAVGLEVVAWNRSPLKDAPVPLLPLDEVLASADILSLHLLLNEETKGFLDRDRLAKTKTGVILVNTARAAVVDEQALLALLRVGHVRHAAFDVYWTEPLPADHPLTQLDNVTLAAHSGFLTPEATMTMLRRAIDIVKADGG